MRNSIRLMTFFRHYLLALLVFNLTACSSMQTVSIESAIRNPPPSGIDYGRLVEVEMLDGSAASFRVTRMNANGLGGNEDFYRYDEMKTLKVEPLQKKESEFWPIVLGILGAAALIFLVANADSVKVCSPSPCPDE